MSVPLKETVIIGPFLRPYAQRLAQGFAADDQDMAMHEARLLLNLVLNGPAPDAAMLYLHDNIEITSTQRAALDQLITDRLAGKPISRMRGWREFFGYLFYLNEATLDPRPDSEILIEAALKSARSFSDSTLNVLDMGTGTGCLLLSFLAEIEKSGQEIRGVGLDASALALAQAGDNACHLGLEGVCRFFESDWDSALPADASYQIIFCNPPYIATSDAAYLADEVVKYDPHAALFAGIDGLADWPVVLQAVARRLDKKGHAFVEIGAGQERAVRLLAEKAGLLLKAYHRDLSGHIRCLELMRDDQSLEKKGDGI